MQSIMCLWRVIFLLFIASDVYAVRLSSVYVNCNTDIPGPPPTITGNVGDWFDVYATGTCADYRFSRGYATVGTSDPAFGTVLNNQIARITLTTAGRGLVYVYDNPQFTRGKSFFLDVAAPPPVSLSGYVFGLRGNIELLYFIYGGGFSSWDQQTSGSFSKTVDAGSDVDVAVMDLEYVCNGINVVNIQANTSKNIQCSYLQSVVYPMYIGFKNRPPQSLLASAAEATTIEPIFPDHPITYTASCTSSDGGAPASGSASSIDWNAAVNVPMAFTAGKTYTCTAYSSAAGYSSSPTTIGPLIPPPPTYTIGGSVIGLASGKTIVLQNNGGDDLTMST